MKVGTKILMSVLAVLPSSIAAQSPDRMAADTSSLLWRDGYVNWRGKLIKPRWQVMTADDGTKFAIDLSTKPAHSATAYIIDGDAFNKNNLFEFHFDCDGKFSEVISNMDLKRSQIVAPTVHRLVCDDARKAP
ncbi:hypothetical protein IVB40_26375 [Bradyrhizobium sp. 40]|jgi:hypothetical protein|uniref:hypothetical protein n=1 Tax=Bradyrhizobium sp. 40 TaxID=2782674 RepID=UPI001FFF6919|nr:hypothetical protein [Bradyrhizobium sp. 40]UPJ40800.1 hypothetical protein IVB40_26375 [Bradyrhizobium sp. 40]